MDMSINDLELVKEELGKMYTRGCDGVMHLSKDHQLFLYDDRSVHTRDRLYQRIDDCLTRLETTQGNLKKDKYIAIKTINKLDIEFNKNIQ